MSTQCEVLPVRQQQKYMKMAQACATASRAIRKQVGALVVQDDRVVSDGYNGTIAGADNECEYKVYLTSLDEMAEWRHEPIYYEQGSYRPYRLVTKPEVRHAEINALDKMRRDGDIIEGCSLFLTIAPCLECAKRIYIDRIAVVYVLEQYRDTTGVQYLEDHGVLVVWVNEQNILPTPTQKWVPRTKYLHSKEP